MTEKTWHGFWWLPGREDHQVAGSLTVQDSGHSRLILIGGFDLERAAREIADEGIEAPAVTILGQCASVKITVLNGLATLTHGFSSSAQYQEISGNRALIGTHLQHENDPAFSSVMITLENFGPFLDRHAFDRTEGLGGKTSSVVYNPADNISFSFDNWKFQVYTHFPSFQSHDRRSSSVVDGITREVLIATSDEPRPLVEFDEMTKAFMDLLTLASGEACGVTEMSLELAVDKAAKYSPHDGRGYRIVEVHSSWTHTPRTDDLPQQSQRFRFTCRDKSFEELTRGWLPLQRRASSATNLLFGQYYARPGFTETRLLSAAVVAESLHGTLFGNPLRWGRTEFTVLRAAIDDAIVDPEQRTWVKARIKNEISFRERLIELASNQNQEVITDLVGDTEEWAKKVVNARNGLAHTGADTEKNGDIFELAEVTLFVVVLALMAELGFSGAVQIEALRRNEYLSSIRHRSRALDQ